MEENKTTQDPFMQAIQGDVDEMPGITETARETTENIGCHKMLSTDSNAESVVNTLAVIVFIIGVIVAFILLVIGATKLQDSYSVEQGIGGVLIVLSIAVGVVSLIQWAIIKVLVNISRNLFNIRYLLEGKKRKKVQE